MLRLSGCVKQPGQFWSSFSTRETVKPSDFKNKKDILDRGD